VVDRHEKFSSRVGLRMQFKPLGLDEVLTVVLPELVFPLWVYDPKNAEHCLLGTNIWSRVNPSLRKLANLLDLASQTARAMELQTITQESIDEAFGWLMTQEDQYRERKKRKRNADKGKGKHERDSEQRHNGQQNTSEQE
jgi:hypothetical protein